MDFEVEGGERVREGITAKFFWIPGILSLLVIIFLLVMKLFEKEQNSFLSWNGFLTWSILFVIVSFGLSILIYFLTSLHDKKSTEREFIGRAECHKRITDEIEAQNNMSLQNFTKTGDSKFGIGWFPKNPNLTPEQKDKIYYHLYKIQGSSKSRYLIVCMNMEKGQADDVIFEQATMNFLDLNKFINDNCELLCRYSSGKNVKQTVRQDFTTGRKEVSRSEEDSNPLDKLENGDDAS